MTKLLSAIIVVVVLFVLLEVAERLVSRHGKWRREKVWVLRDKQGQIRYVQDQHPSFDE